jgi:hypothetical protein
VPIKIFSQSNLFESTFGFWKNVQKDTFLYNDQSLAELDGLWAFWTARSLTATAREAGNSPSALAVLSGVSSDSDTFSGKAWNRGTAVANYIRLDNMLNGNNPVMTLCFAFKITDDTIHSITDGAGIFWPDGTGTNPANVMIGYDGSPRVLRVGSVGWVTTGTSVANLSTNLWYFFSATCNGTTWKYYLNGSLVRTENVVWPFGTKWMLMNYSTIGGNTNNHYSRGVVDEISIWNKVLSDQQIANLYSVYTSRPSLIQSIGVG